MRREIEIMPDGSLVMLGLANERHFHEALKQELAKEGLSLGENRAIRKVTDSLYRPELCG